MTAATLDGRVAEAAARWPERVALAQGERRLTYAELAEAVEALAATYRERGLGRGDPVLCRLPNSPEYVVAMLAAWRAGAIHVGLDPDLTAAEVTQAAELTRAAALVQEQPADGGGAISLERLGIDGPHAGHAAQRDMAAGAPSPADPAVIFFTSGTTGTPKAPLGRHGDLAEGWDGFAAELGFGPDDVHLGHLPLSHGLGMSLAYMALATGGRIVLTQHFSAEEALRLIGEERVSVLNGTPTHFILLTSRLDRSRHDVSSLRVGVGSAAAFPPNLLRCIFDGLDMDLLLMYGSSEGVGVSTMDREDMLLGAAGRPVPGYVAIVDPERRRLPVGEMGEIAFNRDVAEVEYWSGAAGATTPGEWYYSGDLGRMDDDGRLYVLGRLKHQIDRGGLKVDPGEVEEQLLRLPGVLDGAVVGTPNPVLGEVVCACVVPAPDKRLTLEWVRSALAAELASFKLPEELCVLEVIPRTALGKVDRSALRALAGAATGRERLRAH